MGNLDEKGKERNAQNVYLLFLHCTYMSFMTQGCVLNGSVSKFIGLIIYARQIKQVVFWFFFCSDLFVFTSGNQNCRSELFCFACLLIVLKGLGGILRGKKEQLKTYGNLRHLFRPLNPSPNEKMYSILGFDLPKKSLSPNAVNERLRDLIWSYTYKLAQMETI